MKKTDKLLKLDKKKYPILSYKILPSGLARTVIDLGYKTDSVKLVKEARGIK